MDVKSVLKSKKLVIFDMDGTLIDSLGVWNEVDVTVVKEIRGDGLDTEDNMQAVRDDALRVYATSTNPYIDYCQYLKDKYKASLSKEEIHALRYRIAGELLEKKISYKPYADQFIKKLKADGYILAIASTTQRDNMAIYRTKNRNIMDKARLDDYFSLIYTRNDCHEIKPNPEVYLKVLEALDVKAEDAIIFEDSLVGVEAAKRAGVECCVVYDKYSDHERAEINALADYIINDFSEIL